MFDDADLVVVGSGFFGLTIAERVAEELGKRVVVVVLAEDIMSLAARCGADPSRRLERSSRIRWFCGMSDANKDKRAVYKNVPKSATSADEDAGAAAASPEILPNVAYSRREIVAP